MGVPSELRDRVMKLDRADRTELVHDLILSLDEEGSEKDPDWEEAWAAEIEERIRRVEAGETTPIPAEEVLREIRRSLEKGRRP